MKIAIIGGGIAGLGAALFLDKSHQITLFEAESAIGGHSRTINIDIDDLRGVKPDQQRKISVDTGFIVYNKRNYPLLDALFSHLQVPIANSDMSFGISMDDGAYEYSNNGLFAQKRNLLAPGHWQMLVDIIRFNRQARRDLAQAALDPETTLAQYISALNLGRNFRDHYLLPMGAAIWSAPAEKMHNFPSLSFLRFFDNHGLLSLKDRPQWLTVKGGSREYLHRLRAALSADIRTDCAIASLRRDGDAVSLRDQYGQTYRFDQVILACHADRALALIEHPSKDERAILSRFAFQDNQVITHGDRRLMPRRYKAWASWIYLGERAATPQSGVQPLSVSYWMNNLQPLGCKQPIIVTLNPTIQPDPALIYDRHHFSHPLFDQQTLAAQQQLPSIQGAERLWFCGAWRGYGFHEDGLRSALDIATPLGGAAPWL